jgi:hypothetical protein
MSGKALLDHVSALDDPRQSWKVVYPLPEILLVVLCDTLAGAEDFVEIARWGRQKLGFSGGCCRSRAASPRTARSTT